MPPAAAAPCCTLRASEALCASEQLWPALLQALEGRLPWAPIEDAELAAPPDVAGGAPRWAYIESALPYASHLALSRAAPDAGAGGALEIAGTCFPAVLLFSEAGAAARHAKGLEAFAAWLTSASRPFAASRPLLLAYGHKPASLKPDAAEALAASLLRRSVGFVELRDEAHAAAYVAQCAAAVAESRKRRAPSRFKVAGVRCQTLPRDPTDKVRITWVSQLMQVPGVSEEVAKAVAGLHPSPAALLEAVARAGSGPAGPAGGALGEAFLADLEIPIRGKKGTRRVGPVVSRRIFTLFHPTTPPEHVLL